MTWWKVTLNDKGACLSITRANGKETRGLSVFYVEAKSQDEAGRLAIAAYNRERMTKRRAEYKAAGKCRCGRARDSSFEKCAVCREREKLGHQRRRKKLKDGEPVVRDEVARVETFKAQQRDRRQELRLETLLLVRSKWTEFPTIQQFGAWLAQEIATAIAGEPSPEWTPEDREDAILSIASGIKEKRLAIESGKRGKRAV